MAKLKQLIRQLNNEDYQQIKSVLHDSNAEKSVVLIETVREKNLTDNDIMTVLGVNSSAYYTLRSRLNKKIEDYLLQQMEYPRTDLIRKVSNISEIIFNSKRDVAIATLKTLEKELIDYDMSNELTTVYKALKKLHLNSPDYFHYSQLYNRHIAYTLAVDKAEDILNEYFKKYGSLLLFGEEQIRMELSFMRMEMYNVCKLYKSHRLLVYMNLLNIFHRLCVNPDDEDLEEELDAELAIQKITRVFNTYRLDLIYYNLTIVVDLLKALNLFQDYDEKSIRKLENLLNELAPETPHFFHNFNMYTFPEQYLLLKLEYALQNKLHPFLDRENENIYSNYAPYHEDTASNIIYFSYRSLSCYYAGKVKEAAQWLYNLLNTINLKGYNTIHTDIKLTMALYYMLLKEKDLYNQIMSSAERSIRASGKEEQYPSYLAMKIIKLAYSNNKRDKKQKIDELTEEYERTEAPYFSLLKKLLWDKDLIRRISY